MDRYKISKTNISKGVLFTQYKISKTNISKGVLFTQYKISPGCDSALFDSVRLYSLASSVMTKPCSAR